MIQDYILFLFLVYCIFFVIGLVGLCCKPQPLVIIIIISISKPLLFAFVCNSNDNRHRVAESRL